MSDIYKITIERWPYFMGCGREEAQKQAGPRSQEFVVRADGMRQACDAAEQLQSAIAASPQVWQAPIVKVERWRGPVNAG